MLKRTLTSVNLNKQLGMICYRQKYLKLFQKFPNIKKIFLILLYKL